MSPRSRLTAAAGAVLAVALSLAAVLLVWTVQRGLIGSVDSTARERAADAARLPAPHGVLATNIEADNVVQVVDADGRVVASTPNAVGEGRLFTFSRGRVDVRSVKHLDIADPADSYRVVALRTVDGRLVYAAVPDDDQLGALHRLRIAVSVGLPIVVVILVVLTWLLVGRALRPVEAAARKQREFVADAAHELRSPLAALRAHVEVAGDRTMLDEVDRLGRLADDLLQLARLEQGDVTHRPLDLDDIVFDEIVRARAAAPVAVDAGGVSAAQVSGDEASLRSVVRNMLDNAVRHADTKVRVGLRALDGWAELTVADDGPGVPIAERKRIFERFTRLDDARSRDSGGAGLGLAIVADTVRVHGGSVEVSDSPQGAVFVVRLPLSDERATRDRPARPDARPVQ